MKLRYGATWLAALILPIVIVFAAGPIGTALAAGPVQLDSYRAVYELSLGSAKSSSGIAELRGRLVLQWADTCDGYVFDQRILTETVLYRGGGVTSDFTVNSWESADGKRYRFSLKHMRNGELAEAYRGQAQAGVAGRPGEIVYSRPEDRRESLPPGAIFPTEHNRLLLEMAQAGETFIVVKVFDGSGDDGLNEVSAVVGSRLPPETGAEARFAPLKGLAAWPVRLAFFKLNDRSELPSYEIGFRLFENGVPSHVSLEYAEFSIAGKMTQVEILPDPDC